jgi:hypothetical protein
MSSNATARIVVTAVSSACAGLWGYAIPTYMAANGRWRLLALPAAVIAGVLVWMRYGSRPVVDPLVEADVSTPARVAVTAGAVLIGVCGGIFIPFVLTRAAPRWTVAAPLAMSLAMILGLIAWHNLALFFKDRRF